MYKFIKRSSLSYLIQLYLIQFILTLTTCKRTDISPKIEKVIPDFAWTGQETQVLIIGNNFIPAVKVKGKEAKTEEIPPLVKLGDTELKILSFSESKLEVVVPPKKIPGEYKLRVELANKESASTKFRITRLPKPYVKAITPTTISNSSDTEVTIIGEGFIEISEIILISDSGETISIKDFSSSSTSLSFKVPKKFKAGSYKAIVKNTEGITSELTGEAIKVLKGSSLKVSTQYKLDPSTGKITLIFNITNEGEVTAENIDIQIKSQNNTLKKVNLSEVPGGQTKEISVEIEIDESTQILYSIKFEDSLNPAELYESGEVSICKNKWYKDTDGDGYGNSDEILYSCDRPSGYTQNNLDCNDSDSKINPETVWFKDQDSDGYSDSTTYIGCQNPTGYILTPLSLDDCNDSDPNMNPQTRWYIDRDADGYFGSYITQCTPPTMQGNVTYIAKPLDDCDDNNPNINPNTLWFKDQDGDGYSDGTKLKQCQRPVGFKLPAELKAESGDCDDTNPALNPETVWFKDQDGDGYSDGVTSNQCLRPPGFKLSSELISTSGDCNDGNPKEKPGQVWFKDQDNDSYSDGTTQVQCPRPSGFKLQEELVSTTGDCDDSDNSVHPNASLDCNDNKDNNCDGKIETWAYTDLDGDRYAPSPVSVCVDVVPFPGQITVGYELGTNDCDDSNKDINPETAWFKDTDNDGYSDGTTQVQCPQPPGYKLPGELIATSGDCNDSNASIYPGAPLNCNNGQDNDCSGQVETWFWQDQDSDTWTTSVSICANTMPEGFTSVSKPTDCDDNNASIYPGAPLNCNNGKDNDCSGHIETWFWQDQDSDTWTTSVSICANTMPVGFTSVSKPTDCDDLNPDVNPGTIWFKDADFDNYYPVGGSQVSCTDPYPENSTYAVLSPGDCDDNNPSINPGASEVCNGIDDNCNLLVDEGCGLPPCPTSIVVSSYLATATGRVDVFITWNDIATNEQGFVVEKSKTQDFTEKLTYIIPTPNITSFTEQFVEPLTRLYYRVYAYNQTGTCTPTIYSSVDTPAGLLFAYALTGTISDTMGIPINPLVFDLNNDGKKEIIISDNSNYLYAISFQITLKVSATPLWVYYTGLLGGIISTPALAIYNGNATIIAPVQNVANSSIRLIKPTGNLERSIPVTLGNPYPVVVTDINSDGIFDMIIVVNSSSSLDSSVMGYSAGGSQLFSKNFTLTLERMMSHSAIVKFPNASTTYAICSNKGRLRVMRGAEEEMVYYISGEPQIYTPQVADVDKDGIYEIAFGASDNKFRIIRAIKNPILKYTTGGEIISKLAFSDFNQDGVTDLVFTSLDRKFYAISGTNQALICQITTGGNIWSSPATVDINSDGIPDVVFGSDDGKLYAVRISPCSTLWTFNAGQGEIRSSPTIADIDLDGSEEIVFGYKEGGTGAVIALSKSGTPKWVTQTIGGVLSTPAIADINGDGTVEVVVGSEDPGGAQPGSVYIISGTNGTILKRVTNDGQGSNLAHVRVSPALYDINGDGFLDVIFADSNEKLYALSGTSVNAPQNQYYYLWVTTYQGIGKQAPAPGGLPSSPIIFKYGGSIYIVIGSEGKGVYVISAGANGTSLYSQFVTGQRCYSTPATSDFNLDGVPDIVFGCDDRKVYIYDMNSNLLNSFETAGQVRSSPQIYDFNGDKHPDIGIGSNDKNAYILDPQLICEYNVGAQVRTPPAFFDLQGDGLLEIVFGDENNRVYVIRATNCSLVWNKTFSGSVRSSFSSFDANQDGIPDIAFGISNAKEILIISGLDGQNISPFPLTAEGEPIATPVISDIDGDGHIEIVVAAGSKVYAWRLTTSATTSVPWPEYANNRHRTGLFGYEISSLMAPAYPTGLVESANTDKVDGTSIGFYNDFNYGCSTSQKPIITLITSIILITMIINKIINKKRKMISK